MGLLLPELAKHLKTVYATDICLDGAKETVRHHGCQNVFLLPPKDAFAGNFQMIHYKLLLQDIRCSKSMWTGLGGVDKSIQNKAQSEGRAYYFRPNRKMLYMGYAARLQDLRAIITCGTFLILKKVVENLRVPTDPGGALCHSLMLPKLFRITLFETTQWPLIVLSMKLLRR